MNPIEIHPAAQAEYEHATDWYFEKSAAAANRFAIEVEAAIKAIGMHPDRYARLDEMHRAYLLDRFPYYVAYRQMRESVEIIAIRHASQDEGTWKAR